ncbi:MAG: Holliday junction branch migration protein RuvA [Calditrichaeota bacterium]|nr:Holliday junction branch migration protein RuvA [Calditrichota bacterium]RQW03239.1 MAG: Holliday junction branch migration protein RuvA [Calditrichota bacterium]
MIESIRGILKHKMPTSCVVNLHGLGLGINISLNTFQHLAEENEEVELLTYLHVREDILQLYGFSQEEERELFKKLITVSGIGPRLAMIVLSGLSVEEFHRAIAADDIDLLTKIPGVGKKTAQRVILELKEKIVTPVSLTIPSAPSLTTSERDRMNEALLALVTLGYKQNEAKNLIQKVVQKYGRDISLEELIKYALQEV